MTKKIESANKSDAGDSKYWAFVCRLLFKWLNRRSQRRSYNWEQLKRLLRRHAVAKPRIIERGRLRLGFA